MTAFDGLPLLMHARLSQLPEQEYTYISEVALKLAEKHLLEFHVEKGLVTLNGQFLTDYYAVIAEADATSAEADLQFSFTKKITGKWKKIVEYTIGFSNGSIIVIRANLRSNMIFVEMDGDFGGADMEGLLGRPKKRGLFGRDGRVMDDGDVNAYGQEWQVLNTEEKLFADTNRYPQHPNRCIIVDAIRDSATATGGTAQLRGSRRLMVIDNGDRVDAEIAAAEACRKLHGIGKQFCIEDVIATGNLELAEDSFYSH